MPMHIAMQNMGKGLDPSFLMTFTVLERSLPCWTVGTIKIR